ncbi:MAG: SemiSWEET transporter [Endomicrobia bacterium]|nr:SemiSWEET transporter [Endomicrobiia bacterium]MCL2798729.1 SemiSWEET transporter [Endomicrobiia bacterium]
MFLIKIIGYLAGFFSMIAFIPQVYKTWKTKSAKDVSMHMFAIFTAGVFLWIIYGIAIKELPIIIANCVILILSVTQLILKIKYDRAAK